MSISATSVAQQMRHPERGIAVLRIVVGLWFIKSVVTKLGIVWVGGLVPLLGANDRWIAVMPRLLARYAEGNPIEAYRHFLLDTVIPNGGLFAHLTAVAETAVGLGLTFGVLTVLASLIGLALVIAYGLATFWQGPSQQGFHLLLLTCLTVFIVVRAGRCWGVDGWIRRRRPRWLPGALRLGAWVVLCGAAAAARPVLAQSASPRPVVVLADLTFEGRSASSIQPGDSAMAAIATEELRGVLRGAEAITLVDSSRAAAEIRSAGRVGLPCSASLECMRGVGKRLGATLVVTGKVSKISNLIWYLSGQLVDVASGRVLLDDGFELKGGRDDMVPRGAASLGRRIVGAAR